MKPLVSIISPAYNAMPYLHDFLDSVEKQTYSPLELIVVDDGSTDETLTILNMRANQLEAKGIAVKVISQQNAGQVAAVNRALPLVTGELLIWCDADDYWLDHSIETLANCLINHPDIEIARSNGLIKDETDNPITFKEKENQPFLSDIFDELFHERILELAGRFMIRTKLLFECYPNKQIPESTVDQNPQLLLPIASRSKCAYIDQELHVYCRRSTGHSSRKRSFTENMKRIEDIKQMYLNILPYCHCDQDYYVKQVNHIVEKFKKSLISSMITVARKETNNLNKVKVNHE